MNTDGVASYEDWQADLLGGVGPLQGIPYALGNLIKVAWTNRESYEIARGSIDLTPWGFPTDREGTLTAIKEQAKLLRAVVSSQKKLPQYISTREGGFVIPVRWWNMDGYRLLLVDCRQYAFLFSLVDACAAAWRETTALSRSRNVSAEWHRWCEDALNAVSRLQSVLGRKMAAVHTPPILDWSAKTIRFMAGHGEDGEGPPLRDTLKNLAIYLNDCRDAAKFNPTAVDQSAEMSRKTSQCQTFLRAACLYMESFGYDMEGHIEGTFPLVAQQVSGLQIKSHHVRQARTKLRDSLPKKI